MTLTFSAAGAFKGALVDAIKSVVPAGTLVTYGHPGTEVEDNMVGVSRVSSDQGYGPLSPKRAREETLTAQVIVSCYVGGGVEAERVAGDAAYALLGLIEFQVRITDTTVGGTVRDCALTAHESEGETDPRNIGEGRVIEVTATFTAHARITN